MVLTHLIRKNVISAFWALVMSAALILGGIMLLLR